MKYPSNFKRSVIFPDMIGMLIYLRHFHSISDMCHKALILENPHITADHKGFRNIRTFENNPEKLTKDDIRECISWFKQHIDIPKLPISHSDIRYTGNWSQYKSFYASADFLLYPLSLYVLSLCQEEKDYISFILNSESMKVFKYVKITSDFFQLDKNLVEETLLLCKDSNKLTHNELTDKLIENKFLLTVVIHQWLHIGSIIEQNMYIYHSRHEKNETLNKRTYILKLLPCTDINGDFINTEEEYIGAVKKLIINVYSSLGYDNQSDFIESLCKRSNDINCYDNIKKRLNRWKSGNTQISVKKFNQLIAPLKIEVPSELILAATLIDHLYKESKDMAGFMWVINECKKYPYYQQKTIRKCSGNNSIFL